MSDKNAGWVKLWREQFTHEISERKPWCDGYAWAYLYSRANYRPAIVNFRNQYIPVERGEFVTSELKLSKIFGWSRRRVKSFLFGLKNGGMCDNRRTQRFIIISICNYDKYQSTEEEKRTIDDTMDGTTDAQQTHTDKKNKEIKNKDMSESDLSDFDLFYKSYPKHEGRKKAVDSWKKLHPDNALQQIILSAIEKQKTHKAGLKSRNEFCPEWPMPATWLHQRRWEDEIPEAEKSAW